MANIKCPACGSDNVVQTGPNQYQCPYCGNTFTVANAPQYPQQQPYQRPNPTTMNGSDKSRVTAAVLAILLGSFGAHYFYLGKTGKGILYLLFCWTYIPCILGLIEGIMMLTQTDEDFNIQPKVLFK
jgi:TM2 domain-containing membrane protein YozV/predicted RNA-binding Zn-ribbon protein involved in translation (DUF1610 family)